MQDVIDAKIFPPLLWLLLTAEFSIRKQAAWAVTNAISVGSDERIKFEAFLSFLDPYLMMRSCR